MAELQDIFAHIYREDLWGGGSGEGSQPQHVRPYVRFLEGFLAERRIGSVVDFGCGDWAFARHIDWQGALYQGFDIVPAVVAANRAAHARPGVRFELAPPRPDELPAADLLLVKDVLQHWSNARVADFLPVLQKYRYALLTHCIGLPGAACNQDIRDGEFRPIDLCAAPFHVAGREVLRFCHRKFLGLGRTRWVKAVILVENPQ